MWRFSLRKLLVLITSTIIILFALFVLAYLLQKRGFTLLRNGGSVGTSGKQERGFTLLINSGSVVTSGKQVKLLFIAIVTAPVRFERRKAIRDTWMTKCVTDVRCGYKFITDGQDIEGGELKGPERENLDWENRIYGDLVLAQSPPGVNYARRYLWLIQWLNDHYTFQYVLRLDDDYFVCVEKLVLELAFHRPRKKVWWGYLHCNPGAVWIDQGFMLVSQDITKSLVERSKNGLLPCSPWLDQAFATWMNDYPELLMLGDNKRLMNSGLLEGIDAIKARTEVCRSFLGIHQSYPDEMRMYWSIYQREENSSYHVPHLKYNCTAKREYNHKRMTAAWYFAQKPCKDNPIWGKGEVFPGRQYTDGRIKF